MEDHIAEILQEKFLIVNGKLKMDFLRQAAGIAKIVVAGILAVEDPPRLFYTRSRCPSTISDDQLPAEERAVVRPEA